MKTPIEYISSWFNIKPKYTQKTILFGNLLDTDVLKCNVQDFIDTVVNVAHKLEINPNWLMGVMELESARTFDPSIQNSLGYTGLIQFGSIRASEVGTTTDKLKKMNACKQMNYVYKALEPYKDRYHRYVDLYFAIFFPAAIGKSIGYVLETNKLPAGKIASWNPLFDVNRDNQISVFEVKTKLLQRIPQRFKYQFK